MQNFLEANTMYITIIISLIIWVGITLYVSIIENKLTKLEKSIANDSQD